MRSVFFWEAAGLSLDRANPYGGLLARAMREVGVELEAGQPETLTKAWLHENQGKINVLHLNWPNYMYSGEALEAQLRLLTELIDNLALARLLGYRIVWTVHNLYPHESNSRDLDHLAQTAITHLANAVIVHCEHARELVRKHFHRTAGVYVINHGNFIYPYPNEVGRDEARRRMGLNDDHFVFFYFGNVRRYKGIERLIEVFQSLPGEHLRLLLGAKFFTEYGQELVASVPPDDPRVMLRSSRHFANDEFQYLFNAGDVGVFPFLEVLTSGSVITAFSFGMPVIAPSVGCLTELVPPEAGIVYSGADEEGLRRSMLEIQEREMGPMREAAWARAHSLDWGEIAVQTRQVYESG